MKVSLYVANKLLSSTSNTGKITHIISVAGISLGSFALIISIAVLNGFENKLDEKISNFDGNIRVIGSVSTKELSEIRSLKYLKSISEVNERKGIINHSSDQSMVIFKQINFDRLNNFYLLPYIGSLPKNNEILIGKDISSRLGVRIGDSVIISSPLDHSSIFGLYPSIKIKVSGIFQTKILDYDNKYIFISDSVGKNLFFNSPAASNLEIKLNDISKIDFVKKQLLDILEDRSRILSWRDENLALVSAIWMEKIGSMIVLSLILFVASFSILSTIHLVMMKKLKDIGILRLLGMNLNTTNNIIIFQALIIGFKGAFVGIVLGVLIVFIQRVFNIISLPSEIYAMEVLPMILNIRDIIAILVINIFFIFFAGTLGVKKILKFDPIKFLK